MRKRQQHWMKDPSALLFEDQTQVAEIHSSGTRVDHAKHPTLRTDRYAQIAFLVWHELITAASQVTLLKQNGYDIHSLM
jgi:hypothetical protein